ncbi:ATP-binding protein [Oscillospiraceae bacterium LTW-04]|nr:sensor histidine kinase [Oscillospiraceae bacterium MB24-C1]
MAWLRKLKKRGIAPMFFKFLFFSTLMWMVILIITLTMTLQFSLSSLQTKIENGLTSTARTLAESQMIRQSLKDGSCPEELITYLDNMVAQTQDLDVVTVANTSSIRLYHVVHSRIGQRFVGGDEGPALAGEAYIVDGVGTLGHQRRAFYPVFDEEGHGMGFVMASTTMSRINELRNHIISTYMQLAWLVMLATLLVAGLLSLLIRRILLGYGPEEFVHSYLTQNEVINNLNEGIISVDERGMIQLVNRAAVQMLGLRPELLEGKMIDALIRDETGESLVLSRRKNVPTTRPNILCCNIPKNEEDKNIGTTLILTDKTEAMQTAEQLNGTRHIVSALRANTHEFMNKLQVISGLLQMGRQKDALVYISNISAVHAESMGPVLQYIHNPNVAALILAKLTNMRELDIRMTLLANSRLPTHSDYLSTNEIVSIVGNLLENAIEAVNARQEDGPRSIVLQITEDETGLLITVSDTGTGIAPENLPRIYQMGFSTKAKEGRGVGMGLVKEIVSRAGGSIEVDSDPNAGTSFTIICSEKRQRK